MNLTIYTYEKLKLILFQIYILFFIKLYSIEDTVGTG